MSRRVKRPSRCAHVSQNAHVRCGAGSSPPFGYPCWWASAAPMIAGAVGEARPGRVRSSCSRMNGPGARPGTTRCLPRPARRRLRSRVPAGRGRSRPAAAAHRFSPPRGTCSRWASGACSAQRCRSADRGAPAVAAAALRRWVRHAGCVTTSSAAACSRLLTYIDSAPRSARMRSRAGPRAMTAATRTDGDTLLVSERR